MSRNSPRMSEFKRHTSLTKSISLRRSLKPIGCPSVCQHPPSPQLGEKITGEVALSNTSGSRRAVKQGSNPLYFELSWIMAASMGSGNMFIVQKLTLPH